MAGDWKEVPFADVIELISGGTPKTSVPEYWGCSIPWLSVSDFNTGFRWVSAAEKTITERGLAESATTILNQGDIIISARGTVGVLAQLAKPMAFNQSCYGVRGKRGIAETNFVYYALRHAVSQMQQVAHGGVFNTITRDTFKIITTKLPPLKQQQAIAHILGALDDKIELNRRMNRTLEDIARAIFKSWFVDFLPVRAKTAAKEKIAASARLPAEASAQAGGLNPEIAALFPDSFEDSELGEIPKGWRVGTIDDIANINALTLGRRDVLNVIDYIEISEVALGEVGTVTRYVRGEEPSRARRRLKHGDTILSTVRPDRGAYSLVLYPSASLIASTGFAVLTPKDGNWAFLHAATTRSSFGQELGRLADGGAYPAIRPDVVGAREVVLPNGIRLIAAFDKIAQPLFLLSDMKRSECRTLAALRDALLPKLISGELRVPDAEKIAARCI